MIKFDELRMTRSQLVTAINENVIGKNAERNRKLLIQHFADGPTKSSQKNSKCLRDKSEISFAKTKRKFL